MLSYGSVAVALVQRRVMVVQGEPKLLRNLPHTLITVLILILLFVVCSVPATRQV